MQPGQKKFVRFLKSWIINTAAVLVAAATLHNHISYDNKLQNLLVTALLLGILNAFVRPILMFLALPLLIFTLGLFTFVINALLLYLVGQTPFFHVDTFWSAFLGALVISIVSIILNIMTGGARVTVQRRPSPPKKDDDDVIDV